MLQSKCRVASSRLCDFECGYVSAYDTNQIVFVRGSAVAKAVNVQRRISAMEEDHLRVEGQIYLYCSCVCGSCMSSDMQLS